MEHVLTIGSQSKAGTDPADEPWHLIADLSVGGFEDEGYPDVVAGKLRSIPEQLLRNVQSEGVVRVELGGRTYRFTALNGDGTFRLAKDRAAEVFPRD